MQIILLFDLLVNLLLHRQPDNERIASPGGRGRIGIDKTQCFVQVADRFASVLDFPVHGVLEITPEILDLLGLLLQVVAQAHELVDESILHLSGLVRFEVTLSMKVAKNLGRIAETAGLEEGRGDGRVIEDVRGREEQFGARFVGLLDLLEEDDKIFQDLAPCYFGD